MLLIFRRNVKYQHLISRKRMCKYYKSFLW
jgi:hypothetical protein